MKSINHNSFSCRDETNKMLCDKKKKLLVGFPSVSSLYDKLRQPAAALHVENTHDRYRSCRLTHLSISKNVRLFFHFFLCFCWLHDKHLPQISRACCVNVQFDVLVSFLPSATLPVITRDRSVTLCLRLQLKNAEVLIENYPLMRSSTWELSSVLSQQNCTSSDTSLWKKASFPE